MKVFISWSGTKSHKVALVFRDWFPSVIQSIEPYVSSEDIDKGARWSTDIASELENSTFGVLCVTKENLDAPWLSFEAGALSKTMDKAFVSPFLFDLKRSEVHGPILQFQSTIFEKDDIKKLIITLNKACGENGIADARLDEAFEVWYPNLEKKLKSIQDIKDTPDDPEKPIETKRQTGEILEEILDLSRNNQKLLRNPDNKIYEKIEEVSKLMQEQVANVERSSELERRRIKKFYPMFFEDFLHFGMNGSKTHFNFLIVLSLFKADFPWIYDIGKELIGILKSKAAKQTKMEAVDEFRMMVDFTFNHPILREMYGNRKDSYIYMKEVPHMFMRHLDRMAEAEFHLNGE